MEKVEVIVAHEARVTLRVGDVFLKVDSDQTNLDTEIAAIGMAPIPTPKILWQKPSVLAISAVQGTALGRLGEASPASPAAWSAAGAAARRLHDAPAPSWPSRSPLRLAAQLDEECALLIENGVLPRELVERNHAIAQAALRPAQPAFIHGDLQLTHVFVDGDEVVGVIDWSEGGHGDPMFDLATLTLGHEEHLDEVLAGYGGDVDRDAITGWWSLRSLTIIRWLTEHGFDPFAPGAEVDVLTARM
jgi:aminoglycoside phosphotransferase (APT) family kinase protein